MPAGRRDTSYLLFRSTSVELTGNGCRASPTPGRSCPHGAHLSFTCIHPMSRCIPPNLSARLTRACGRQKNLLVAQWSVNNFGGLAFRAHVAEMRRVDVDGTSVSWQGPGHRGQGSGLAAMQRCLVGSRLCGRCVALSRRGHWGFGMRRREWQKLRAFISRQRHRETCPPLGSHSTSFVFASRNLSTGIMKVISSERNRARFWQQLELGPFRAVHCIIANCMWSALILQVVLRLWEIRWWKSVDLRKFPNLFFFNKLD